MKKGLDKIVPKQKTFTRKEVISLLEATYQGFSKGLSRSSRKLKEKEREKLVNIEIFLYLFSFFLSIIGYALFQTSILLLTFVFPLGMSLLLFLGKIK